ncbi:MAG: hypothetical protein RBT63_08100, partial [Bdellovibrionales bacterium]|nr:hypothetical protein [Bdellovibrionales bacterium]
VEGEALERLYQTRRNHIVYPEELDVVKERVAEFETRIKKETPPKNVRDFEFYSFAKQPSTVADPDIIRAQRTAEALAKVDLSPGMAITKAAKAPTAAVAATQKANEAPRAAAARGGRCELLFHPAR